MKARLKKKDDEIEVKDAEFSKYKRDHESLIQDNETIIRGLQERLNDSDKKISQLMRESLSGSTNAAVQRLQNELERCKNNLNSKEENILKLKRDLDESTSKYQNLKRKVRQYQIQCKAKESRLTEHIQTTEDQYRAKLLALRDRMEDAYVSKQKEVNIYTFIIGMDA